MLKRLLIVVDDWEALEVYESLLGSHFDLRTASMGSEGIALALEQKLDRIFLDLTMEDMHVSEACEQLRARAETRSIPLTVVFNKGEEPFEREGVFPLRGDQVLQRPYDMKQLIELLRQ